MRNFKPIELTIFITSLVCLFIAIFFDSFLNIPPLFHNSLNEITENISIYEGDSLVQSDVTLPFKFHVQNSDDKLSLVTSIPDISDNVSIGFLARTSTVEVYIDGEQRYSFLGEGSLWRKNVVDGATYHFIPLSHEDSNKIIKIEFKSGFRNISNYQIDSLYYGTEASLMDITNHEIISLIFGIFLVFIGFESVFLSILISNDRNRKQIRSFAIIAFALGIWVFSQSKSKVLVFRNQVALIELSYFALYLLPYGVCRFIKDSYNLNLSFLKIINTFVLIFPLTYVIIFLLQVLGISKQLYFLKPMAFLIGLFLLILSGYLFYLYIKGKKELGRFLLSELFLILSFCVELLSFDFVKVFNNASPLHLGMFLFGIGLFSIVLKNIKEMINERVDLEAKAKIAYIDGLTKVGNRQCYNKDILDYQDYDFTFFMIDVNRMKDINDQYGHIKGDMSLKTLAEIIESVFRPLGKIYRYGGDEFVVFYQDISQNNIDKVIHEFNKKLYTNNDVIFGASIGYAVHKKGSDFSTTVKEADAMMYRIKSLYK